MKNKLAGTYSELFDCEVPRHVWWMEASSSSHHKVSLQHLQLSAKNDEVLTLNAGEPGWSILGVEIKTVKAFEDTKVRAGLPLARVCVGILDLAFCPYKCAYISGLCWYVCQVTWEAEVEFVVWDAVSVLPFCQLVTDLTRGGVAFFCKEASPSLCIVHKLVLGSMEAVYKFMARLINAIPEGIPDSVDKVRCVWSSLVTVRCSLLTLLVVCMA